MEQLEKIYYTKVLTDKEAETDKFEEQAHKKVAQALGKLITENRSDDGGFSISLLGDWGSGKSTVISLLKQELKTSDCQIFSFDAWTHEGDPLKRIFIEGLIDFICNETGWMKEAKDKKALEKIKEDIEQREIEETTYYFPKLSILGIAFIWTIFVFIPLIAALVSIDPDKTYPFSIFGYKFYSWGLGLLGLGIPVGTILFLLGRGKQQGKSLTELFQEIVQANPKEEYKRIVKPTEITSIEFEEKFQEVLEVALDKNTRTLVIVIDNLDRLPAEEALSLWSTMKTFTHSGRNGKEFQSLWLIAPFDPQMLIRFWKKIENCTEAEARKLTQSFIHKTFQLSLSVPPPVLTDWKKYLEDQFLEAFQLKADNEDHRAVQGADFQQIYKYFETQRVIPGEESSEDDSGPIPSPTPREIKIFVNNLIPYYEIMGDSVPLPIIALYTLHKDSKAKTPADILGGKYLKKLPRTKYAHEDIKAGFASLYYSAKQEKALTLLVGENLRENLYSNLEGVKEIQGKLKDHFWTVLDKLLSDEEKGWATSRDATDLFSVACNISQLEKSDVKDCNNVFDSVIRAFNDITNNYEFTFVDQKVGQGIVGVLTELPRDENWEEKVSLILSLLQKNELQIPQVQPDKSKELIEDDSKTTAISWLEGTASLIKFLKNESDESLKEKLKLRVPGSPLSYIKIINHINTNSELYSNFLPHYYPSTKVKAQAIYEQLASLTETSFLKDYSDVVLDLLNINAQAAVESADTFANVLGNWAQLTNPDEFEYCIKSLTYIALKQQGSTAYNSYKTLVQNGLILHYIAKFDLLNKSENGNEEKFAFALLPVLLLSPDIPNGAIGQVSQGWTLYQNFISSEYPNYSNVINHVLKLAIDYKLIDILLLNQGNHPAIRGFIQNLVERLLESEERSIAELTVDRIIEYYPTIFENFLDNEAFKRILKSLFADDENLGKLRAKGFNNEYISLYGFISSTKRGFFTEILDSISKSQWDAFIQNDNTTISEITEYQARLAVGSELTEALISYTGTVQTNSTVPSNFKRRELPLLVLCLKKDEQRRFINSVIDLLLTSLKNRARFFRVARIFGSTLIESDVFYNRFSELAPFMPQVLNDNQGEEIKWLRQIFISERRYSRLINSENMREITETLHSLFYASALPPGQSNDKYSEADRRQILRDIGTNLGIAMPLEFILNPPGDTVAELKIDPTDTYPEMEVKQTVRTAIRRYNINVNNGYEFTIATNTEPVEKIGTVIVHQEDENIQLEWQPMK